TCALNNIIPDYFKIQIVNAEVTITGHSYSTSLNSAAKTAGAVVYSKQLKTNQVTDKVVLLNQQLQASGGKWFAGVTTVSLLPNNQLQKMFTKDDGTPVDAVPNLQGLQYYKGGIFEIKNSSLAAKGSPTDSNIIVPDSFDWRNVNGEDWMTPVKTQQGNSCAYYGTVGSYESIINLFYNQHLNIDLSEQMYIDCSSEYLDASLMMTGVNSPIVGLSTSTECTYKSNFCDIKKWGGLADEACDSPQTRVPDSNNKNCNAANICSDWKSRLWGISDYYSYSLNLRQSPAIFPGGESMQDFNKFKSLLIKNGPLMSGYDPWGHVMVLTGYGIIKQGDNAISGSTNWSSMIIPAGSPLIGQTYWMFKNSWGTDWGDSGYGKFVVDFNVDMGWQSSLC
ncbi:MAG: hypothetical protein NT094_00960, partial [Candidatus Staskawiczbacteria bacterium]|nr:hypothetical protein [Candidatus Staskawiczbacteria bacterium]